MKSATIKLEDNTSLHKLVSKIDNCIEIYYKNERYLLETIKEANYE